MKDITFADLAALRHTLQWLGAMRYVGTMIDRASSGDVKALAACAAIIDDIMQLKLAEMEKEGTDG
jgi:hypothetical protein